MEVLNSFETIHNLRLFLVDIHQEKGVTGIVKYIEENLINSTIKIGDKVVEIADIELTYYIEKGKGKTIKPYDNPIDYNESSLFLTLNLTKSDPKLHLEIRKKNS